MSEVTEVKVRVVKEFRDRTADLQLRKKGETLTVSEERAKKLEDLGYTEVIQEEPLQEEPLLEEVEVPKTAKKATTKKG